MFITHAQRPGKVTQQQQNIYCTFQYKVSCQGHVQSYDEG